MPVSSYIIRCQNGALPSVRRALAPLPGVTIGPAENAGLAVVTETASLAETEALEGVLRKVPQVLEAVLVYHNFEDLPGSDPPVNPTPIDSAL